MVNFLDKPWCLYEYTVQWFVYMLLKKPTQNDLHRSPIAEKPWHADAPISKDHSLSVHGGDIIVEEKQTSVNFLFGEHFFILDIKD